MDFRHVDFRDRPSHDLQDHARELMLDELA